MSERRIRRVAETGSTNADLLAALATGDRLREGEWLVADRQSAGKGRQGRAWSDGVGNFMGSTVVYVGRTMPPPHTLALVTGLALYETVLPSLADPSRLCLKWPNDLLLQNAKLAGILLEREADTVVIGIGVNLARAPKLSDRRTVALADLGPAPDRDAFATTLANSFAVELGRWRDFGLDSVLRRWSAAAHSVGTPLSVHEPGGEVVSGSFAGLAMDGSLQLRLADGSTRAIHAGDVHLS